MSSRPIGVFDSGIGGLTVLKQIKAILPHEDIIYFGDTARVPYGSRSSETVTRYTFQSIRFLMEKNIKALVIACNTASARSLHSAKDYFSLPMIGVIKAGAKQAVASTSNQKVGIIGTEGTINSKAYDINIHLQNPKMQLFSQACPLFVPLVEEGWENTTVAKLVAKEYLINIKKLGIDTLVLGCTHYPLLEKTIQDEMGPHVRLIDPAIETAKQCQIVLSDWQLINQQTSHANYQYYVSDQPEKFKKIGESFMQESIDHITKVDISSFSDDVGQTIQKRG